ncbi:MAG: hypothetical protein KGR26_10690, partial [Cyanobacteria bacterium REEB65]|nr:hypothetical protein [Cyanobacteria bacterium REEB65]
TNNQCIREISAAGSVTTLAGGSSAGWADGSGTTAQFHNPMGLAIDRSDLLYVADASNNRIRQVTEGGVVTTIAGSSLGLADAVGTRAKFDDPVALTLGASGDLFVADQGNNAIRKITPAGVVTTVAGGALGAGQFNAPAGLVADPVGDLFVCDDNDNRIRRVSAAGSVSTLAGSGTGGFADGTAPSAEFQLPFGIALDASGDLFVADWANNRIREVQ